MSKRMVHVSSCASFDQVLCKGHLHEQSPRALNKALAVYGRSKYAGEMEFLKVVEKGLEGVICYPTGVYGPIDYSPNISRISAVLLDSARGKIPAMVQGSFDLVDVRDIVTGLVLASERGRSGENYLLGGHYVEMMDACRLAASHVGRKGPRVVIPIKMMKALAPIAAALTRQANPEESPFSKTALETIETSPRVDRSKAETHLGYAPRALETTVRDLITFFVEQGEFRHNIAA
jgi:dihydroflavonol-4-reductase